MTLADARALSPGLRVHGARPEADQQGLQRLTEWCGRYSPWVASDGADGIKLDITGCAHLFGGEAALLADLEQRLGGFGVSVRAAVADSLGAAWGLARFSATARTVARPGEGAASLAPLPVAALGLSVEMVEGLERLGLGTIGKLARLPPPTLAARFGSKLVRRLDRALGREEEPVSPDPPASPFDSRLVFAEPIGRDEDIAAAAEQLTAALCAQLAAAEQGARRLVLRLYLSDGGIERLAVGCSRPSRDPGHLSRLLRERLANLEIGFGADVIALASPEVAALGAVQLPLGRLDRPAGSGSLAESAGTATADPDLGLLIDRLGNRLGFTNIARLAPFQSHLPERAVQVLAPLAPPRGGAWASDLPRPVRLLPAPELVEAVAEIPDGPPLLFRWRGRTHQVARADGPERIAPEWWHHPGRRGRRAPKTRDYYRVEDGEGARFWLYREGLFGGAETPRWYLHGLFA